jgi:hypothetical protein
VHIIVATYECASVRDMRSLRVYLAYDVVAPLPKHIAYEFIGDGNTLTLLVYWPDEAAWKAHVRSRV